MDDLHTGLRKKVSSAFFLSFLIASPASAKCPSGFQFINGYTTDEVRLRWADDPGNTYSRCLNTKNPEKNNVRDSYGINDGYSDYQCGNVKIVNSGLINTSLLNVQPADPSLPSVLFGRDGNSINWTEPRVWCEQEGNKAICYEERQYSQSYVPETLNINKRLYYLNINRRIDECRLVSF